MLHYRDHFSRSLLPQIFFIVVESLRIQMAALNSLSFASIVISLELFQHGLGNEFGFSAARHGWEKRLALWRRVSTCFPSAYLTWLLTKVESTSNRLVPTQASSQPCSIVLYGPLLPHSIVVFNCSLLLEKEENCLSHLPQARNVKCSVHTDWDFPVMPISPGIYPPPLLSHARTWRSQSSKAARLQLDDMCHNSSAKLS